MYNVVFEFINKPETYPGYRTWCSYQSKDVFDVEYISEQKNQRKIIAEGNSEELSSKKCINLCGQTSFATRLNLFIEKMEEFEKKEYGYLGLLMARSVLNTQFTNRSQDF